MFLLSLRHYTKVAALEEEKGKGVNWARELGLPQAAQGAAPGKWSGGCTTFFQWSGAGGCCGNECCMMADM